jgi:hypothetical protein
MEVFRNYEATLGQTLNYFVLNSVILCGVIFLYIIYSVIVL